jgi:hypothetical protein
MWDMQWKSSELRRKAYEKHGSESNGIERSRTVVQVALSKRHGEGCPPSCFSEDDPIYFEVPLQQLLDFSCAFFTFINRLVIGFLTVAQLP